MAGVMHRSIQPTGEDKMRILLIVLAALVLASGAMPAEAQGVGSIQDMLEAVVTKAKNVDLSTAINLAGRQRMLIQKMSKEACFVALGIAPEDNRKRLHADIRLFEETLHGLRHGSRRLRLVPTRDPGILRQIAVVERMWKGFKPLLLQAGGSRTREAIHGIARYNMPLLKEMNGVVILYERHASRKASAISRKVNLAGRQRMLTQKMTKEACFIALGVEPERYRADMARTAAVFDRVLEGLLNGDRELGLNRTFEQAPRRQLLKVKQLWKRFRPLLKGPYDRDVLNRMSRESLVLLAEMDKAVKLLY